MKKIVLDAGHGGWDNGAMYDGRKEKDDNLKLTLAVGDKLKEKGFDVAFTRTQDIYQSPLEKAKTANDLQGDYFVSIHRNASVEPNQYEGVQTLLYEDTGVKKELADSINLELEKLGFDNLGRSVRPNLAVLRRTQMPALLVEVGFLTSDRDNTIFDEKYNEIVNGIAEGIIKVLKGQNPICQYSIQVGLFRQYENAKQLEQELASMGYTVELRPVNGYFAVWVGNFQTMEEARRVEKVLQEDGYETWIIAK